MFEPSYHILWQTRAVWAGIFLVIESLLSMKYSKDQRNLSKFGRWVRLAIGAVTIYIDGFVFLPEMGGSLFG